MNHVSLFSGIGGFNLACDWLGIPTILNCEIDPFCQKVLKKHWPDVPIVKDVNDVEEIKRIVADAIGDIRGNGEPRKDKRNMADEHQQGTLLLTAGFPCQPFSCAGRRRGKGDDRYLWPQTMSVIEAIWPTFVLLENVAGILSMVFPDGQTGVASQASFLSVPADEIADYDTISGGIDRDLRQAGYETLWLLIPACGVGAPHRRDRVWIVAHDTNLGCDCRVNQGQGIQLPDETRREVGTGNESPDASHARRGRLQRMQPADTRECGETRGQRSEQASHVEGPTGNRGWQENWYEVATRFCRVDDGLPRVVDRVARLKALGNAIVPQVAYEVIKSIGSNPEVRKE